MPRPARPNRRVLPTISGRVVGYVLSVLLALTVFYLVTSYESTSGGQRVFTAPDQVPAYVLRKLDAVLVLGGGAPQAFDEPPVYVQQRCDDALAVVNSRELPILCLSAGTAHVPQALSENGLPIWESTACAAYLEARDVPVPVYVETVSYDTIGNAFFTRTTHTDVNGWRNLLIITNEFHMKRTKAIFDWIFNLNGSYYRLYYLQSPNRGVSQDALDARQEKEANSLLQVQQYATKYQTMRDVWEFLNTKHSLYTATDLVQRANGVPSEEVSDTVKKLYGGN